MGLYLPNMEMPENCAECPFLSQWDDCGINHEWKFADEFDKTKDRLPSCPLVQLPKGHGRLIDADKLYEVAKTRSMGIYGPCNYQCVITGNDILKAPTIIPAEGGREVG